MFCYQIGDESPPLADIPENLLTVVDTLVRKAWTVDPVERPAASDLLMEECFQIIYGDCKYIYSCDHTGDGCTYI